MGEWMTAGLMAAGGVVVVISASARSAKPMPWRLWVIAAGILMMAGAFMFGQIPAMPGDTETCGSGYTKYEC